MKKLFCILLISIIAISGCSDNDELSETITILDENGDLPIYSEWGYNTFGAYYDRKVFMSRSDILPLKVIVNSSGTNFVMKGELNSYDYYGNQTSIVFNISDFKPTKYRDLLVLNDSVFDLENNNYSVFMVSNYDTTNLTIIEGNLYFKKVQDLYVDDKPTEVILSGLFRLKALENGEPITISDGRFDLAIGYNNFYYLE
jgi:hypothetical protein